MRRATRSRERGIDSQVDILYNDKYNGFEDYVRGARSWMDFAELCCLDGMAVEG